MPIRAVSKCNNKLVYVLSYCNPSSKQHWLAGFDTGVVLSLPTLVLSGHFNYLALSSAFR